MKPITLENQSYELIKDYKNGFDLEEITKKFTDFFVAYDYVFGDWAYGKLRLKGFCGEKNKLFNKINDYKKIDDYIKNHCAYECKHFIIKKV